ncbi:MAG: acyltransferase family protein [Acidimicrobiales bacterium]
MTTSVAPPSTGSAPPPATAAARRVTALDGLRGFALIGMLAWHAELDWVRGGFARMTVFFVLSGYLATRSWNRRRDEGFRSFWIRRTLRLLPMTLVGVAVAIAVTLAVGSQTTKAALGADVVSVLTYTSNWHFLDSGQSYGALFERQSAFQHYWSLSIEEQLFLVLPVLLAAGAVVARSIRRPQWVVLGAAAALVGVAAVVASPSADGVYFGTQTRLIEFLVGAALAVSFTSWSTGGPATRRLLGWLGRLAGGAIVITLAMVDRSSSWLYEGGIYLFALPVIAVVAAIEVDEPWLTRVLEIRPLVWLGRAALSIYVLHWPLFVLLEDVAPEATSHAILATGKVAVGVAVGGVAHRLIEQPMLDDTRSLLRNGLPVLRRRVVPMAAIAALLAVVALGADVAEPDYEFEEAAAALEAGRPVIPAPTAGGERVAIFGGSTALMNALGIGDWARETGALDVAAGDARLGCGLLERGERPQSADALGRPVWRPVDADCRGWTDDWRARASEIDLDVALVFFGVWEIADWRVDGETTSIEEPALRRAFRAQLEKGIDRLIAGGVREVVLMTSPVVGAGDDDLAAARGLPDGHAERTARYNQLLRDVAADRSDVTVFDYAGAIEDLGADRDRLMPDGVHPTWGGAGEIWSGATGEALVDHLDGLSA